MSSPLVRAVAVTGAATALILAQQVSASAAGVVSPSARACSTPAAAAPARAATITTGSAGIIELIGDNVHVSSGQASGHGWWDLVSGDSPGPVVITVQLQAAQGACGVFRDIGSPGRGTVKYPGGGSANRVTGKFTCLGTGALTWRSKIDGSVAGQVLETPGYSAPQTIKCTP